MKFPVVLKSKNPYVSDEAWTDMVAAHMAQLSQAELQGAGENPIVLAEARLQDSLDHLFQQLPVPKDPYEYVDLEYGKDESVTKDEVLAVRSMRDQGLTNPMIAEILGLTLSQVHGIATGSIYPCLGGKLHSDSRVGLCAPSWHKNLDRMQAAVLAEAMTYLPPDLFELLCQQNGLHTDQAFDAVNILEDRNDEEDRHIYRSFLRGVLRKETPTPGAFEPAVKRRGRRPR